MSLSSFEARRYAGPNRFAAPKIHTLKYSVAAQQKNYRFTARSLNPDAVDPALLYAKLEVAKLEVDASRREAREQKRTSPPRPKQHGLAARGSLQGDKAFSRRQKELMRRSLPVGTVFMADGKPVYNTAQILAALELDDQGKALAQSLVQRHDSARRRSKRASNEQLPTDSKRESHESDREEEEGIHMKSQQGSTSRRKFKAAADDGVPVKLVATKHGSQTTYERAEARNSGLLEDADASDADHGECTRPRLGHDRPHWAQQSQNASDMNLLKQAVQTAKRRAPRPLSQIPGWEEQDAAMEGSSRAAHPSRSDSAATETLIADAVNQIKREERSRKWQSVQNFLKRPPCA